MLGLQRCDGQRYRGAPFRGRARRAAARHRASDLAAGTSDKKSRNKFALSALDRLKTARPKRRCSTRRDLERIPRQRPPRRRPGRSRQSRTSSSRSCEDHGGKARLYTRLEPLLNEIAVLTSNTSDCPSPKLMEGRGEACHGGGSSSPLLQPVRYAPFGAHPRRDANRSYSLVVAEFGETVLGKGVVFGAGTTNFVANRIIGTRGMMGLKLALERASASKSGRDLRSAARPAQRARCSTADLVGLDTVIDVAQNCYDNLPDDEARPTFTVPELLRQMVGRNLRRQRAAKGFYHQDQGEGMLSLDLKTLEYKAQGRCALTRWAARNLNTGGADRRSALQYDRAAELA